MTNRVLGGLRRAAFVVCDSDAVHAELLSYGVLPPDRVSTVPLPAHPDFSPHADPAADAEAARLLGPAGGRTSTCCTWAAPSPGSASRCC